MTEDIRQTYIEYLLSIRFGDVFHALLHDWYPVDPGREMERVAKDLKYKEVLEDMSTAQLRSEYESEHFEAKQGMGSPDDAMPTAKRNEEVWVAYKRLDDQYKTARKKVSKRAICKELFHSPEFNSQFGSELTIERIISKKKRESPK